MKHTHILVYVFSLGLLLQACGGGTSNNTVPPPTNEIQAPTDLTATPRAGEVVLNWSDESTNETGFEVEKRANSGDFAVVEELPVDTESYTDRTVETGISYAYRIRAVGDQAASEYTAEVAYMSQRLEPTNEEDEFVAVNTSTGETSGAVGFSSEVFASSSLEASASSSTVPSDALPDTLKAFGPEVTISVPLSSLHLGESGNAQDAQIIVSPEAERAPPGGATTYTLVQVETLTGGTQELILPYNPNHPELPVEISVASLRFIDREHGLKDPLQIRVLPVFESDAATSLSRTAAVRRQEFGLFLLSPRIDYDEYSDECDNKEDFWAIVPTAGVQDTRGKTPLVLVHGWQTLANSLMGAQVHLPNREFTPYICDWINFLRAYAEEENLHDRYQLYTYSYDSDSRVEDSARKLRDSLEEAFPDTPAVVVGHSMGGLVASLAKRDLETNAIQHIISLGTPYRGSAAITCKKVEGGECVAAMITPLVKDALVTLTAGISDAARMALTQTLTKSGTKDLAYEQGMGTHRECELVTENPLVAGGIRFSCQKVSNEANPALEEINRESPPSSSDHTAIAGQINQGSSETSGPGSMARSYDIIGLALLRAHNYASDGIVPVHSAVFGSLGSNGTDSHLRHSIYPRAHHSALNGRNGDDSLSDPLPEVMDLLENLVETPEPRAECEAHETSRDYLCIRGTIENWSRDQATIHAERFTPSGGLASFAEGSINSDGSFSLSLPPPSAEELIEERTYVDPGDNCTGSVTAEPESFSGNIAHLRAYDSDRLLGDVYSETKSSLIYVTQSVSIIGEEECTYGGNKYYTDYELILEEGWNLHIAERNDDQSRSHFYSIPFEEINNFVWQLGHNPPPIYVPPPHLSFLEK